MPATPAAAASRQPQRRRGGVAIAGATICSGEREHRCLHQQRGAGPGDNVRDSCVRPGDDGDQCRHQECRTGYRQRIVVKHLDALLLNASKQRGIHCGRSRQLCVRVSRRGGRQAGGRGRQESATLRDQHCLRAVAHVECFEHCADVRLDGAFSDVQCARDFLIGEAASEHADDFELPQRQAVGIRLCRQIRGRGHEHVAGQNFLDRDDHLVGRERLRDEARGAGRYCTGRNAVLLVAGNHDAGGRREFLPDDFQRVEGRHRAAQVDVEQHQSDIRIALERLQCFGDRRDADHACFERALLEHGVESRRGTADGRRR